ncbi:MAG: hypothetical protein L3J43_00475 [Sulfurovum sp.]|nr:hypothetical protein [Sulfurovum sp.]
MRKLIIQTIKYLLILSLLIYTAYQIKLFLTIDKCLDEGGAWDYPKGTCVQGDNISTQEIECLSKHLTWDTHTNLCKP